MPRVLGIDIPGRKKLAYSLRYIFGVGPTLALEICKKAELNPDMKADDLQDADIQRLVGVFCKMIIELKVICVVKFHRMFVDLFLLVPTGVDVIEQDYQFEVNVLKLMLELEKDLNGQLE